MRNLLCEVINIAWPAK